MKISRMTTNHILEPLGFAIEKPVFSWIAEDAAGDHRTAAEVKIATDPKMSQVVFDSGKSREIDPLCFRADFIPEPSTRYYWSVEEWDDAGDTGTGISWFETPEKEITGKWVRAEKIENPCFMKKFSVEGDILTARLYITGVGLYEAYINGKKAGDEYLAPFYNDYKNWIQFQTYDVTDLVRSGENAIGVVLGNGWYRGRFGFVEHMEKLYGDTQQFACDLVVRLKNGREEHISSDESFVAQESPFLENSIYDGEIYDSRKEIVGFATSDLDLSGDSGWKSVTVELKAPGRVVPRLSPYLRIYKKMIPTEVIHTPAGETVLDFGQEMVGLLEFRCREPEGTEVHLQCGEILQNGNFYNDNLRTAKEELRYIADGNKKIYRSHFTFYGFRYLKVSGVQDVRLEDFAAYVLTSEMEETGDIRTDNSKINRLIQNVHWGQRGNFVDVPTDCPQRDERMGWTGDAQVFCATASFNAYTAAFYRKFMHDMLLEQQENEYGGSVPFVVPDILTVIYKKLVKQGREQEVPQQYGSTAWGDVATIIPWTQYVFFGDRELLKEQYANMTRWIDWMHRIDAEKCGGSHLFSSEFTFGDWLALDNYHKGSSFGGTDNTYVSTAYYLYSATLTARAAKALGLEEDAEKYTALADEIRLAMQKEYFTDNGRCACDTQTALVLALYLSIVPERYRDRTIRDLKQKLDEEQIHLTTGFVGTAYLCKTLSDVGLGDYAYRLLLNEDFPSWLYEVNMGATTIWERWNSVLPDGSVSDTGMNSLNHYAYGAVLEWMYRYMGGIQPDPEHPGFRHFRLAPSISRHFRECEVHYRSASGMIQSHWLWTEGGVDYQFRVPFDTICTLEIPGDLGEAVLSKEVESAEKDGRKFLPQGILVPGTERMLSAGRYHVHFSVR
ncbi:MAG: family 78 glycoside hydrolase catalytic domain [Lachnospiraceae bacterium]|nr:family 78 glycoside hydrolase catalytic domain [Lachnospiraceae bacterium]